MADTDWLLHTTLQSIPESLMDVPGVNSRKNGSGFIVPHNTVGLYPHAVPSICDIQMGWNTILKLLETNRELKLTHPYYEHQLDLLAYSFTRSGSVIWAPPAAGKTRVAITWLLAEPAGSYLVICKSTNVGVWCDEIAKWSTLRPRILRGATPDKAFVSQHPGFINILPWESLHYWYDVLRDCTFRRMVMDEVHMAKNYKRVKAVVESEGQISWESRENWSDYAARIARNVPWRLTMTGTPIANTRMDLWAQLDLAEPFCWGTARQFGMRYLEYEETEYGIKYGKKGKANEELKTRFRFTACRISNQAIAATLPPFRRQTVLVKLADQTMVSGFVRTMRKLMTNQDDGDFESHAREALIMEAAARKRDWLLNDATEALMSGQKICILTGRRLDAQDIYARLFNLGTGKVYHADSEAEDSVRSVEIANYMKAPRADGKPGAALIGTGYVLGTGLNLQDTDIAYIVMLPNTPDAVLQWEKRFIRPGRTEPVLIKYPIAEGTIDEDIREIVLDKLPDLELLLDDSEAGNIVATLKPVPVGTLLSRLQACLNKKADHDAGVMESGE